MTDKAYGLDFLQQITDVHFGGQWFAVEGFVNSLGSPTNSISVDFPDQSGGTPGINLVTNSVAAWPPATAAPISHTITNVDLIHKIGTHAGLGLTGFGLGSGPARGFNADGVVFLKMDRFPASTFRVRFQLKFSSGSSFNNSVTVATIKKNAMKAGLHFSGLIPPFPIQSIQFGFGSPGITSLDFRINPTTLQVSGPF